jgi:uncharacterized membrane protein HdeD (DUF308 family)
MPETEVEGRTEPLAGTARQTVLVAGACSMIMGVVLAVWPHKSLSTAELLSGGYLLLNGVVQLVVAVGARLVTPLRVLVLISGGLSALLAMLCFAGGSTLLLSFWIGLAWTIRGICHATVAVWADDLPGRARQELFGLLTLALGLLVGVLPFDSLDALGWATGACLLAIGAMEALFAAGPQAQRGDGAGAAADRVPGWLTATAHPVASRVLSRLTGRHGIPAFRATIARRADRGHPRRRRRDHADSFERQPQRPSTLERITSRRR